MRIQDNTIHRNNNFDFIRLVMATLVIVAHSYPLAGKDEILSVITNGQIGFGALAIDSFFILSGYFIFQSMQRSKSIADYFWKRILRLYPALIVLLLFTLAVLPFIYNGPHLTSTIKNYGHYFVGCLSLYNVQYLIPGVFENNPYPKVINGSLWSLSYEFTMYIIVSLFIFIRKAKYTWIILFVITAICGILSLTNDSFLNSYFNLVFLETKNFYKLAAYFFAGSLLTYVNLQKINFITIKLLLFALTIISLLCNLYIYIAPIALPFIIMLTGMSATKFISATGRTLGDISYGVYIYGFLVQQMLMNFLNLKPLSLMVLSISVTYVFAYLSWHLVEKRMLKYKNLMS